MANWLSERRNWAAKRPVALKPDPACFICLSLTGYVNLPHERRGSGTAEAAQEAAETHSALLRLLLGPRKAKVQSGYQEGGAGEGDDSELAAFKQYAAANAALHPRDRLDPYESPARVERLLRLAAKYPVPIRPESLLHSSLDLESNELWQEAGGLRLRVPAAAHQQLDS